MPNAPAANLRRRSRKAAPSKQRIAQAENETQSLSQRLTALEGEIAAQKQTVDALEAEIAQARGRMTEIAQQREGVANAGARA